MSAKINDKQLALPAVGKALELLGLGGTVAALLDPTGTSAVIAATTPVAAAVILEIDNRIDERQRERVRLILEDLRRRVARLETRDDPPVDLYTEMLRKAITDDDDRKVPLHGVLIEWVASTRPDPSVVRLALNAVATLTYPELRAFVSWYRRDGGRLRVQRPFSEHLVWTRLLQAGLVDQIGVIMKGNVTEVGKILAEGCPEIAFSDQEWQALF